ncbi:unnamed protein product [Thlaspi arvense]|uniref:Uncharacterized protein n=1 Tax=Thlaspi arvense TaxID=13288 RepID=A0AAU9S2L8_THLAR|nr:unnamed protein product [Thlaspi arvense]
MNPPVVVAAASGVPPCLTPMLCGLESPATLAAPAGNPATGFALGLVAMSITLQAEWSASDAMHQGTSATEPLSKIYKIAFEVALFPISWAPFQSMEKEKEKQERTKDDDNFVRCCNERQYCNFSCRAFGCIIHFIIISFCFLFLFFLNS